MFRLSFRTISSSFTFLCQNRHKLAHKYMNRVYLLGLLIILAGITGGFQPVPVSAQESIRYFSNPTDALQFALTTYIKQIEPSQTFQLGNIVVDRPWTYSTATKIDKQGQMVPDHFIVLLGHYSPDKGWYALAPRVSKIQDYNTLLNSFPDNLIDEATKAYLQLIEPNNIRIMNLSGHKLPWAYNKIGYVTQKNGYGHENQVDFDIEGRYISGDVYASKPGTVVFVKDNSNTTCQTPPPDPCWKKANIVVVQHGSNEYSWYVHLAYNSATVSVGDVVSFGTKIGVEGNIGYSSGTHLHYMASTGHTSFTNPDNPNDAPWATGITEVDFAEVTWSNLALKGYTSQNDGDGGSSQVQLYSQSNFGGSVVWQGSNDSNGPNADSYSMKVPSGWSVKVYDQDNYGGSQRCWKTSVNNLQDHGWQLRIRSIRVYSYDACPAPPTPVPGSQVQLYSQSNFGGSVVWQGSSDSDGPNANSYSMKVPSGWSVKVYDQDNYGGSQRCWNTSVNNLQDHGWQLRIRSIRVYSYNACPPPPPPAPTNVQASDGVYTTKVRVTWNASTGATGYEVWRHTSNNSGSASRIASSVTSTSYDDTSATPGQTYYYWVKAKNSSGTSGFSSSNSGYRQESSAPNQPGTPYEVSITSSSITFGWADNSNNETGFKIYKWAGSSGFVYYDQVGANVTTFTDTGVPCGNQQWYQVTAFNSSGESARTGWVEVRAGACIPSSPTNVQASDGTYTDKVRITWNASTGATGYEVWRHTSNSSGSASRIASSVSGTSYDDTTATPGQTYYYWVKAKNSSGTSGFSSSNSGSVSISSPAAPTNVWASDGVYTDKIRVTWSTSTEATAYEVWRHTSNSSGSATRIAASVSGTSYDDTSATLGQTYYYWVKAKNSAGTSGFSSSNSGYRQQSGDVYEPDDSSTQATSIVSGVSQTHSIVPATDEDWVKFTLSEESGVTIETGGPSDDDTRLWLYDSTVNEIEFDDDNGTGYFSKITRECGSDALPAGDYYIKVDEYGNDEEIVSYAITLTVVPCLAAPTNVQASDGVYTDKVRITWNPVAGATSYEVWRDDLFPLLIASSVTGTSYDDTTGTPGVTYYYYVKTVNSAGTSGYSSSDSGYRRNPIPNQPGAPHKVNVTSSTITFSWSDNANNETGFKIYKWSGSAAEFVYHDQVGANVTTYTDTNLNCESKYWYKVTAFNTYGESQRTGWLEVTTGSCGSSDTMAPTFPVNNPTTGSPLISPVGGTILNNPRPTFDWHDAADNVGVAGYTIRITGSSGTTNLQTSSTDVNISQSEYTPTFDLADGAYTWTVQAYDAAGNTTSFVKPETFIVAATGGDARKVYLPLLVR